jgi:hypothetical protein
MDPPDIGHRDPPTGVGEAVLVHPHGSIGVPTDLHVLAQLTCTGRSALSEQDVDIAQEQRVALDRRGVVSLLAPDLVPHWVRGPWGRETAETGVQVSDRLIETEVDVTPGRPPNPWHVWSLHEVVSLVKF